jgi:WD40 repeat protein
MAIAAAPVKPVAVFPGLRPFRPDENILFFGREEQTDELLRRLKDTRFLAVVGLSGTGKSSLVHAGLIPALRRGHLPGSTARWRVATMRPGVDPLDAIVHALNDALGEDASRRARLRSGSLGLVEAARIGREAEENLLLVVDQFEELFRFQRDTKNRAHEASEFVALLAAAVHEYSQDWPIYVVLTMRSDYLGECARFTGLARVLNDGQYLTEPMTRNQLKDVIEGPAGLHEVTVDSDLLEELLDNTAGQQDQLPVLQHLLMRMWGIRTGARLTWAEYNHPSVGGFDRALDRHADTILASLPEAEQAIARKIFQRLTERGEENRENRRPTQVSELAGVAGTTEHEVCEVIEKFRHEDCSFLTSPDKSLTSRSIIDISHESLIRRWNALKQWTKEEAESGEWYQTVENRYNFGGSLSPSELDLALNAREQTGWNGVWAERYCMKCLAYGKVMGFLDQGQKERLAEEQKKAAELRRLRKRFFFWMAVAVGCICLLCFAGYSWFRTKRAESEARRAYSQTYWVLSKEAQNSNHDLEAVEWAAQAVSTDPTGDFRWAILHYIGSVLPKVALANTFTDIGRVLGAVFGKDGSKILTWNNGKTAGLWDAKTGKEIWTLRHEGSVLGATFNTDETQVLTWSEDKTVRLWDVVTGKEVITPALMHEGPVSGAMFNKDESQILTWSADKKARLWGKSRPDMPIAVFPHHGAVYGAMFNKDESQILTWSADNKARLWGKSRPDMPIAVFPHDGPVYGAVFNKDESQILTWSLDRTARLWDARDLKKRALLVLPHEGSVGGATFNKDGNRILTWGDDNTARVWDANTGRQIGPALTHGGPVLGAAFDKDETHILTWSLDRTARLWDAHSGTKMLPALYHTDAVRGAVFNKDESQILTWSDDKTFRVWDAANIISPILKHEGSLYGAVFDNHEKQILAWGENSTVRLWDADKGRLKRRFPLECNCLVRGAVFSNAKSQILTWSDDKKIRLWDAVTGEEVIKPALMHKGPVYGAIFNKDESQILSWSDDGTARLWDAKTGKEIRPFRHAALVHGAAFNKAETQILTWSADNTARMWDAHTPNRDPVVFRHDGPVYGAVFNKDESQILTWSADNTARMWDARTPNRDPVVFRHDGPVYGAVFNKDESQILTWSADNKARLWDKSRPDMPIAVFPHDGAVLGAVFDKNDSRILTWSLDNTAQLWDSQKHNRIGSPLRHDGPLRGAVFMPDKELILTWSADNTARLWDARTGQMGPTFRHDGLVGGATFSKDETRILTWSNDKTVRLWNVDVDSDFPPEDVETRVQAATGVKLDLESRQSRIIEPDKWREVRAKDERIRKAH